MGQGYLFSVHLLTASGAAFALFAALSAFEGEWRATFLWLGVALFVDGVDGPLARRLRVAERLPQWDGSALDVVIDYTTYVFIPALILAEGCGLVGWQAVLTGAVVTVTGALYYADSRMKQPDNSFRGFPVVWNMAAFLLFVFSPHPLATLATVLALGALTFLPVNFVHPVRVVKWRPLTLSVVAVWSIAAIWLLATDFAPSALARAMLLLSTIYLFGVAGVQQYLRRVAVRRA